MASTANPRLAGYLGSGDADWLPGDEAEAQAAVDEISRYCGRYCPARLACVEEDCRLYRIEGAALEKLGYDVRPAAAAVGVQSQPVTGL